MPGMSPHMKIKKGRPLDNWPGGNTPPVINIQAGFNANPDTAIPDNSFVAIATDAQQGDISANVVWNLLSVRGIAATQGVQNVDEGNNEVGGNTSLDADTAGLQVVDLGGPPGGGASTGLVADTAGEQTIDVGGSVVGGTATGLTPSNPGDATAEIAGDPAGTVVPGVATQNWDVDVTFDVGGLQQLVVAVNIADDYDDIAVLLNAQVTNGTVTFSSGDFVATSATPGAGSTAVIAAGTDGTGDLFAAITAAAGGNPAITFSAPTPGATPVFTATVNIDGGGNDPISIVGDDALTYADLITELDADTSGASWSLASGDLVVTSDTTGVASTISVLDTNLFSTMPLFNAINGAVAGTTTVYTATVDVDGAEAAQPISIVGNDALTFDDLITELDADTTGASWLLGGAGLVCTSDSTGVASAVLLNDTNLFSTLTGFSSIVGGVPGTTTVYTATITIDGNAPTALAITGDDAQTFQELLDELNAIVGPAGANFDLGVGGNELAATSDSTGSSSTILIADTDLFSSLSGFNQIDAAVDGVDEVVEETVQGGVGGNPTLNFTVLGVQDVEASITDGFGATTVDTESVDVVNV